MYPTINYIYQKFVIVELVLSNLYSQLIYELHSNTLKQNISRKKLNVRKYGKLISILQENVLKCSAKTKIFLRVELSYAFLNPLYIFMYPL